MTGRPHSSPARSFGERVRVARERLGQSQSHVEKRCGMAKTWLSQIENGHRYPSLGMLRALCVELDISADWLLGLPTMPTRP